MDKKPNISKHLLDRAAFIFIRHPEQVYTRADIQHILGTSKATACRILNELSPLLNLKEEVEDQMIYYSLSKDDYDNIYQTLNFILAVTDKERLALNFLLHSKGTSELFEDSISGLGEKLDKLGLVSYDKEAIQETVKPTQMLKEDNNYLIDTLFSALESKTKIEIEYKAAFSDSIKKHGLYPVGLYLRDSNLYLYAYNPKYNDATSFAYSRIKSISLKYDEHYTIPKEVSMENAINDPFGIAMSKPQKAKVHIFNKQVDFEKEKKWPKGTILTDNKDGSITIELTIADPFAFKSWALSLGKDCLVEEPKDIADWVRREHEEAVKLYK